MKLNNKVNNQRFAATNFEYAGSVAGENQKREATQCLKKN